MHSRLKDPETHYRRLENMYLSAPTNVYYKPVIRIESGSAEINIPIRSDFYHAGGAVHGSVYFKAADDAAFFAANSLEADFFVLTAGFHIYFLRPIKAGSVRARGQVIQKTGRHIVAESHLHDDRNRLIGKGMGSFTVSKIELKAEMGYC